MAQHYFDSDPGAASRPGTVDLVLADQHLRLGTDRGVFSPDKVDLGTRVLLDSVPPPPAEGLLLDVGCGYGPIALTMAGRAPAATVLGVDVNARALALAAENARANGRANTAFARIDADGTFAEAGDPRTAALLSGPFAAIWSNPPIRVGKPVLHAMLRTWLGRLTPDGHAHLVVQKHLGADSLQRWLDEQGHATERVASRAGYRVLRSTARPADAAGPRD